MTIQKFENPVAPATKPGYIWGEKANLAYFFKTSMVPVGAGSQVDKEVTIKTKVPVKDYPGDKHTFTRKDYQCRKWGAPYRRGSATPGKTFWLIDPMVADDGGPTQKREFTFSGALLDLYNWLTEDAKVDLVLMAPSGRSYPIKKAGSTPLEAPAAGAEVVSIY
jgi:hypothetical protein